jgi:hypothetical protein
MTGESLISAFGRTSVSAAWAKYAGMHVERGATALLKHGMTDERLRRLPLAAVHDIGALLTMYELQAGGVVKAVNADWLRSVKFFELGIRLLLTHPVDHLPNVPGFSPIGAWACRFHLLHAAWYDSDGAMRKTYFPAMEFDPDVFDAVAKVLITAASQPADAEEQQ